MLTHAAEHGERGVHARRPTNDDPPTPEMSKDSEVRAWSSAAVNHTFPRLSTLLSLSQALMLPRVAKLSCLKDMSCETIENGMSANPCDEDQLMDSPDPEGMSRTVISAEAAAAGMAANIAVAM